MLLGLAYSADCCANCTTKLNATMINSVVYDASLNSVEAVTVFQSDRAEVGASYSKLISTEDSMN